MAKAGRGADQYMLRFPPGLRDRIKTAAEDHGRSMNEEIIRTLEKAYPEPWPLQRRLQDIAVLVGAFRKVRGHEKSVDAIAAELVETAEAVVRGQAPEVSEEERRAVQRDLFRWRTQILSRERMRDRRLDKRRDEEPEADDE